MQCIQVGCTPLHRAASTGNSELCELLIEEGADVDAVDKAGQTPLMNAVICHNKEVGFVGVLRKEMLMAWCLYLNLFLFNMPRQIANISCICSLWTKIIFFLRVILESRGTFVFSSRFLRVPPPKLQLFKLSSFDC